MTPPLTTADLDAASTLPIDDDGYVSVHSGVLDALIEMARQVATSRDATLEEAQTAILALCEPEPYYNGRNTLRLADIRQASKAYYRAADVLRALKSQPDHQDAGREVAG